MFFPSQRRGEEHQRRVHAVAFGRCSAAPSDRSRAACRRSGSMWITSRPQSGMVRRCGGDADYWFRSAVVLMDFWRPSPPCIASAGALDAATARPRCIPVSAWRAL